MVFTSIPASYLDAANWQQQQQNHHHPGNTGSSSHQLLPHPPPPPPPPSSQPHGAGSIRPGSMTDRARMANLPMPETALKCPRCESTNTKFCYFNNYSLSQPRHFCKTCRRYWTRGGALRNVPVGGGCRRNKRSKGSSSSKSPASCDRPTGSTSSTNSVSSINNSVADIIPQISTLRFMPPLHQLNEFGGPDMGLNYGLSYGPIPGDMSFQLGSIIGGLDQWRMPHQQTQQFPNFMVGNLDGSNSTPSGSLYPNFEGNNAEVSGYVRPKVSTSGVITQLASVKMEDSRELNLSSQFLGSNNPVCEPYWSTSASSAAWTDVNSGFNSSSTTSHQL